MLTVVYCLADLLLNVQLPLCFMCEHVLGFVGDVSLSLAEVTCTCISFMYFIAFMSVTDVNLYYVKKRGYGSSV